MITPSYNQGIYIEQTIRSVIDQGYPNLEYIVIDGGSSDNTVDILKKYSGNITYWVSEPDQGQTDAINKGFALATGDIINWLNSDDYLAPGILLQIARSFSDSCVKAVTSVVVNFMEDGASWTEQMQSMDDSNEYLTQSFLNQPGTFFRRDVWQNYFPIPTQLRYTMDQYLWFCFWLHHSTEAFKIENFTSVYFRRHPASKTTISLAETVYNHLGKDFFNEHHLLFWSFFTEHDSTKADVLSKYFWEGYDYEAKQIAFPTDYKIDRSRLAEIFELYLFQLVKEDFRHGFFKRMKFGLSQLKKSQVVSSNLKLVTKMRLAVIGGGLVRQYRKIYWQLHPKALGL